ncbi:protein AATF-like isoform X2 [Zophobas morio]|uniref:protein AATF-like isoform X2 n=1 Tax=Zophobas morio TaxID=2755281 RepID=UPI003082F7C7
MKQKLTDRLAALRNPAPIDAELLADEIQYQIHNSSEELPDLKDCELEVGPFKSTVSLNLALQDETYIGRRVDREAIEEKFNFEGGSLKESMPKANLCSPLTDKKEKLKDSAESSLTLNSVENRNKYDLFKEVCEIAKKDDIQIHKFDENITLKGQQAKLQISFWESLIKLRIRLQPLATLAHQFPQGDLYLGLRNSAPEAINKQLDLSRKKLTSTLLELFILQDCITKHLRKEEQSLSIPTLSGDLKNFWEHIKNIDESVFEHQRSVIDSWSRKAAFSSSKASLQKPLKVFNKSIHQQVETVMLDKEKLVKRSQVKRAKFEILGEAGEDTQENENIYDDSDFYHHLLRELISSRTSITEEENLNEMRRRWLELKNLKTSTSAQKNVDRRASKGRKLRYVVHEKLVNFMFPITNYTTTTELTRQSLLKHLFE